MKKYRAFLQMLLAFSFLLILNVNSSSAQTWYIKPDGTGDAPTIQAGINLASAGDIVLLAAGTYTGVGNRDIDFLGKAITVTSESGAEVTIIDCETLGHGFRFQSSEGFGSVVSGLTIQNGNSYQGGGIGCWNGSPTITGNIITGNSAEDGGGIFCSSYSSPTITNNTISGNTANSWGGGIKCEYASPLITGNTINGNTASYGGGISLWFCSPTITENIIAGNRAWDWGGGILCWGTESLPMIANNTITENDGGYGGGICCWDSAPTVENNIIVFSSQGEGIYCWGGNPTITCCNIYGNTESDALCGIDGGGNFSADPEFCGELGYLNYYLQSDSPCAPGNHPYLPPGSDCGLIGALPVMCGTVDIKNLKTWGEIKVMYK